MQNSFLPQLTPDLAHSLFGSIVHQQKQLSLRRNKAHVRKSRLRPMRPLRPGRLGVLCVSCLVSGASRRPFRLPQAPCVLVAAHFVPPPSATISFRLRRPAYPYQIVRIGCDPRHSATSTGLDPSAGIPEYFIRSLPPTTILLACVP